MEQVKSFSAALRIWLLSFVGCTTLAIFAFKKIDLPVARLVWQSGRHFASLGAAFGATVILTLEAAVVLVLVITRLVRGHISRFAETLALACLASICAYGVNDQVLKPVFGVPTPGDTMHGARHGFHFMTGFGYTSFPSGHMVLAGAFVGVFVRFYRASIAPLACLLLIAATLLVLGEWHFVSDVIAGAFIGVSAGALAAELWAVHMMGSRYG
jgi:membrane-associated phospholipid phosphatase